MNTNINIGLNLSPILIHLGQVQCIEEGGAREDPMSLVNTDNATS